MKVSVVTVCFNAVGTIERTILSVINQTYKNIEYIVIDGRSTDGTLDIIYKYRDHIDYFVSEPDKGIFDAMNKGIKVATGEWIIFLNAGDTFVNSDVVLNVFKERDTKNLGVIFGQWYLKYNDQLRLKDTRPFYLNKSRFRGMGFSHQSVFVRTEFAKKYLFDLKYQLSADYNMIWSLYYDEKVNFLDLGFPVSVMEDKEGTTVRNYEYHLREVARICGYSDSFPHNAYIYYLVKYFQLKRILKYILLR